MLVNICLLAKFLIVSIVGTYLSQQSTFVVCSDQEKGYSLYTSQTVPVM